MIITADKILISIHRTATIIWAIKIIRTAGTISSKQNCLRCKSLQRVGIIKNSKESPGNQAIARFPGFLYAPYKVIEAKEEFKEAVYRLISSVYQSGKNKKSGKNFKKVVDTRM